MRRQGRPSLDHEAVRRYAGAALEQAGKVVGAHVHDGRDLGRRQILVEVLLAAACIVVIAVFPPSGRDLGSH